MSKAHNLLATDTRSAKIAARYSLPLLLAHRIADTLADVEVPSYVRLVLQTLLECSTNPNRNIPLFDLQLEINHNSGIWLSDRSIKHAIKILIEDHGISIGASRTGEHGYFFVRTPAQSKAALTPLLAEIRSLARRCNVLSPRSIYIRQLHGQEVL